MSKVVGIDLGTTNSLVAYVKDGVPLVIRDQSGDGLVPSVVSVTDEGTVYLWDAAGLGLQSEVRLHAGNVLTLGFAADGRLLVTGTDRAVRWLSVVP